MNEELKEIVPPSPEKEGTKEEDYNQGCSQGCGANLPPNHPLSDWFQGARESFFSQMEARRKEIEEQQKSPEYQLKKRQEEILQSKDHEIANTIRERLLREAGKIDPYDLAMLVQAHDVARDW